MRVLICRGAGICLERSGGEEMNDQGPMGAYWLCNDLM
jgi:hypothetical protein